MVAHLNVAGLVLVVVAVVVGGSTGAAAAATTVAARRLAMGNRVTSRRMRLSHAIRYGRLCIGRPPCSLVGDGEEPEGALPPFDVVALEQKH